MIIWLASYPKSGNTWIRIFLDTLLFSQNENKVDINYNAIGQFPLKSHFNHLTNNVDNLNEFAKNCITAQESINLDNKIKIFKTHNAYWKHKETNYSFTNEENTLGVIYIVRDPRNIITSVLNYFNKANYDKALEFMQDEKKILGGSETEIGIPTIISSWSNHYNSWKKFKKNNLLIKYENLVNNPREEFFKITDFLTKLGKFNFDENKILEIIKDCEFSKLSSQETNKGFIGNTAKNRQLKRKFFNLGPENDWKKLLSNEMNEKVKKLFKKEMEEIGYI